MKRRAVALTAVALLVGCGADDRSANPTVPPVPTPASTPAPAAASMRLSYVDARGVTVTIASTERIIPLDGDVAEIVFALGMGDSVVATDLSATYPPEADAIAFSDGALATVDDIRAAVVGLARRARQIAEATA